MHCFVYASQRKPDTYVWLTRRDGFDLLPEPWCSCWVNSASSLR